MPKKFSTLGGGLLLATLASAALAQAPPIPPLPPLEIRIATAAPPSPRREVVRARPGPQFDWVEGAWHWEDGWVWIPGRWIVRPTVEAKWVRASYAKVDGGWKYVPPHWSHQKVIVVKRKAVPPGHAKAKGKGHKKHS